MEAQAKDLLATLKRPAVSSTTSVNQLNALKSEIKHCRVPESAIATIFDVLRLAVTQQVSSTLALSAFSTLGHLVKRLKIQDPNGNAIVQIGGPRLLPALQERLGDLKEPVRQAATQALTELYSFLGQDVEHIIREEAIAGSANARAKEAAMQWVVRMHRDEGMPFKSYVSPIVARVEDSDGTVREAAKNALVDLFSNAPDRAKTDLKKQLKAHGVRHSIETQILSHIGATTATTTASSRPQTAHAHKPDMDLAASTRSLPALDHVAHFADSINSEEAQPPPQETVQMDPLYVHSQRELEDAFRDMLPHFEGKESEHNWTPRDKAVLKIRRFLKGNAPNEYHHAYMAGIKSVMDGILKVANSLRTTMATNGCQLVQELARTLGPALDSHVEILLQNFIKMSAVTKPIAAAQGKATCDAVFQTCSYNIRMMQHIWNAAQDKNAAARQCVPEWLRIVLRRQAGYKSHFESSGGLELAEKCIRKGLDDAKPAVKEGTRHTYWVLARDWPQRADKIMSSLDEKSKSALQKDSHNPNASLHASTSGPAPPTVRPGGGSRMALREMMAEQRKAKAAGVVLPERPSSAMATISPAKQRARDHGPVVGSASRQQSHLRENRVASNASTASETPSTESGKAAAGGRSGRSALMSGPVRRPRRPEISRPQTADPYASRRMMMRPETPANGSPGNSPPKGQGTAGSKASNTSTNGVSGIPGAASSTLSAARNRAKTAGTVASPSGSPVKRSPALTHAHPMPEQQRPNSKGSSTGRGGGEDLTSVREDDFTMVMPQRSGASARGPVMMMGHKRPALGQTMSVDSGIPAVTEDDGGFTMVIPNLNQSSNHRARSPLAYRSPLKAMFDEARERLERSASPPRERERLGGIEEALEAGAAAQTPSRRGSPVKAPATPQPEEIQIYEDPFSEDVPEGVNGGEERRVLGELQVNENVRVQSPTQSQGSSASPAGSPRHAPAGAGADAPSRAPLVQQQQPAQDRAEVLRSRRLLASGIERIRTKTLDGHGFRRVQDLAKTPLPSEMWDGGKYEELLSALLSYLETFDSDSRLASQPPHKAAGLKAQALGLVRALLTLHRKSAVAGGWYPKALVTVFVCKRGVDGSSHLLTDMEKTVDDIVRQASPEGCIDATLVYLPTAGDDKGSARSVAMALTTLRRLLESAAHRSVDLGPERKIRLTAAAARYLDDGDADVRKADIELASDLFELFGQSKAEFWNEFRGTDEGRLGLLTYYIARKSQGSGQVVQ